jgi:hypothetical protein
MVSLALQLPLKSCLIGHLMTLSLYSKGTIMKWEDGRYLVQLSNMYSVRVKVENVRL